MLEDLIFRGFGRCEVLHLFALGDGDRTGILEQLPGRRLVDFGLLGVNNFCRTYLFVLKKLLSVFTGRSTLAQVCPVNFHVCLLVVMCSGHQNTIFLVNSHAAG